MKRTDLERKFDILCDEAPPGSLLWDSSFGMLFIDAVDLAEHGKLEEAAARLEKAAAYLWGTARPKEWV